MQYNSTFCSGLQAWVLKFKEMYPNDQHHEIQGGDESGMRQDRYVMSLSSTGTVLFLKLGGGYMNVYHNTLYAFSYVSIFLNKFEPNVLNYNDSELSNLMMCTSRCTTDRLCVNQFIKTIFIIQYAACFFFKGYLW